MRNFDNYYTVDLETTTDQNDCRVWAWGICNISNFEFYHGINLDSFFDFFLNKDKNCIAYFHNLKFDSDFLFYWLFENEFTCVESVKELKENSFTTIISDTNLFYMITICFWKSGKNKKVITFYDSYKILPFSVKVVAKSFNLPFSKLDLDYHKYREPGYLPTDDEIKYLKHDVLIMAKALNVLFSQNMTKWTQGSNALMDYKNVIGEDKFNKNYPPPYYDEEIRKSYKGGVVQVNEKIKGKIIKNGIVLDVNSLYPYVMYTKKLPVGEGIYFKGEYKKDKFYDIYIQNLTCQFEIKNDHLPTIQLKNNLSFIPTEYIKSSRNKKGFLEFVNLCLTSVDLELFLKHYHVYNIVYHDGWKFMSTTKMFKDYIDKWMKIKIESEKTDNQGMRTLAKLMLNALYGKFATNPKFRSKFPYYNTEEDMVKFKITKEQIKKPLYLPVGTFITSYARELCISSAQLCYNRFLYCDTDSLHLSGTDLPKELNIDKYELGAWKHELTFCRAKYVRQKCYIEEEEITLEEYKKLRKKVEDGDNIKCYSRNKKFYNLHITCAGMSPNCYKNVTFENFKINAHFKGALKQKRVKGGTVLIDTLYTMNG